MVPPLREAQRSATMPLFGIVTGLASASARKKQKRRLINSEEGMHLQSALYQHKKGLSYVNLAYRSKDLDSCTKET